MLEAVPTYEHRVASPQDGPNRPVVLKVEQLRVQFPANTPWWQPKQYNTVLDGIDFELYEAETLALLGPSGCGKSTLARTRSEEHTSELQSRGHLVCRLLLANKN